MKLNERIQKKKKQAGLTQAQLAQKLNVNRVTVTKYENGTITPPIQKLFEMSRILDCKPSDLIGEDDLQSIPISEKINYVKEMVSQADEIMRLRGSFLKSFGYDYGYSEDYELILQDQDGNQYIVDMDKYNHLFNSTEEYFKINLDLLIRESTKVNEQN